VLPIPAEPQRCTFSETDEVLSWLQQHWLCACNYILQNVNDAISLIENSGLVQLDSLTASNALDSAYE